MVTMKNLKIILFLIILSNFGDSQQRCQHDYFVKSVLYPRENIYLLESNYEGHSEINEQFINEINKFKINPTKMWTMCQMKVEDMIVFSKDFPYLINLYVPDFYQNNHNKVIESLAYAGDIDDLETEVKVCKARYDENRTCDLFIEKRKKYSKLTTNQIEETQEEIFRTVLKFQKNQQIPIEKKLNVVNCSETMIIVNDYDGFEITNHVCSDENQFFLKSITNNTLAILTPTVFNFTRPIDNPVVFYEDSYITKETKDLFRNSMTAVRWQLLKHGFLLLIKKMEWERVAIISDSNEFSEEFEEELTALFRENGIAYMAETCVTSNCSKVINKIDESFCKIIVANFDLENMKNIAPYAKSKRLVTARHIKWITRNLSVKEAKKVAKMLNSEIFNISFKTNFTYILQMLNEISGKIQVNCDVESCSFSEKEAATELKNSLKTSKIIISTVNNRVGNDVGSITIEKDRITNQSFYLPNPLHIRDTFLNCTIWNNRFEQPCNDTELVLLMVVLSMFFLTVLGVLLFFQSSELMKSYRRMP